MEEAEAAGGSSDTTARAQENKEEAEAAGKVPDTQGRALATTDGYQGTEPGHKEDKSEGSSEELEEAEGSDKVEEEEVGTKAGREGTEDPLKWLKQGRKRKPRKGRGKLL